LLAAPDPASAVSILRRPERAGVPWLELTRLEEGAHLRLHEPEGSCLLPWARGALLDAGVRLAFTVLGVRFTQHFSRAMAAGESTSPQPSGTLLEDAGDGWWRLTLERFLALEGWQVGAGPKRARRREGDGWTS